MTWRTYLHRIIYYDVYFFIYIEIEDENECIYSEMEVDACTSTISKLYLETNHIKSNNMNVPNLRLFALSRGNLTVIWPKDGCVSLNIYR